jgi:tyrosinase
MTSGKKQKSMYEQVTEILDSLQGKNVPSYQGLNAFWRNPEIFLNASLYGQRLIAPKGENQNNEISTRCGSSNSNTVSTAQPIEKKSSDCCGSQEKSVSNQIISSAVRTAQSPTVSSKMNGDCWPSGGSGGDGGIINQPKRSDQSAIIKGLKGEYPFDGKMFPKLLWDTKNTANADQIDTIANWIDADCPLTLNEEVQTSLATKKESNIKIETAKNATLALATGLTLHKVSTNKTNEDHNNVKGLTIRKEISSLTIDELTTFRDAISCMNQYNDFWQDERSFDFWARIHTNSCQHGWEQFAPWHRLYLYFFEQKLQDFNPNIALPYWSWSDYADANKTSFNNQQYDLGVLPDAYGCFLTPTGLTKLKNAKSLEGATLFSSKEITLLETITKKGTIFNSGLRFLTAAGIPYEIINLNNTAVWSDKIRVLYNVLKEINPLWFPNRWPGSMGPLSTYPTKEDIDLIVSINNFGDFGGGPSYDHHYGALEKVHNGMHNFSGGTNPCYPGNNKEWDKIYKKLNLTADPQSLENPVYGWMTDNRITAFDPLFWGHHSNVDRIWSVWQESHSGTPQDMDGALAPWSLGVKDAMSIQKLGYVYMRDSVFYNTSNKVGIQKFSSEPATVSSSTLDTHRKAEIKLHRVQKGNLQNAQIRIFLNTPNANASTPTVGNDNFVEEVTTFHGSCYGGPSHCNLPLDKTRANDLRSLHHHEPRNYKIDATAAVQRVLNNGAKNITIQLVVVGINGETEPNALFLEGVSLNFMD